MEQEDAAMSQSQDMTDSEEESKVNMGEMYETSMRAQLDQLPTINLIGDGTLRQNRSPAKYESVDDLIGKIEGIERTILIDKENDTLLSIIEKIALIPDAKLVLVEPIYIPCPDQCEGAAANPGKVSYATKPKVKGVISLPDVFSKLLSNQTV